MAGGRPGEVNIKGVGVHLIMSLSFKTGLKEPTAYSILTSLLKLTTAKLDSQSKTCTCNCYP